MIGANGWIAVTRDERIRYKPNELSAVMRHGVGLLVVIGKATHTELARSFVLTVPRIVAFVERHDRPFIAKVYRPRPEELAHNPLAPGSVSLWLR